jgi:beta-glucanase (GH16 family)
MRRRWTHGAAVGALAALLLVVAATPSRAAGPSGVAMPVGNLARWTPVLTEDFSGSALDEDRWQRYRGTPSGDPFGWFDPSHLRVRGGKLVIDGYRDAALHGRWATGGVATQRDLRRTYGKYLVRMRFDRGVGINHAILLWPADESFPPEIDFSESDGHGKKVSSTTIHYGRHNAMIHRRVRVDLRRWHTVGVEWTRGRVVYTLDGRAWATVNSVNVASRPMKLAIQTQAWGCQSEWAGCVNASTPRHVRLEVDWVVIYAPRRAGA